MAIADAELVRRTLHGDMAAFGQLVDRHRARVFTVAYRLLRDRGAAEDVTSDAFLRAYDALGRYDPERSFATWVGTIVSRMSIDVLRRSRSRDVSLEERTEVAAREPVEPEAGPESRAVAGDVAERVREAVARLPDRERTAVVLRHLQGMGYREIAEIMGIPVGTAKTHAFQGRRKLAALLEQWDEE